MALTLVTSDLIGGLDYSKLTGTVPTWNQNTTGTAATVTGASQSNITSLGTLTGLTISGDVTFTGASYNAVWDTSANLLQFADNAVIRVGTGNDVDIYHSSNVTYIKTQTDLPVSFIDAGGADMLKLTPNGAVDLYHNGTLALSTAAGGISNFSGDVGIGATPTAQRADDRQLQIKDATSLFQLNGINSTYLSYNAYFDGTWKRRISGYVNMFRLGNDNNGISFYQSDTGSAGSAITFTEPFCIKSDGKVGIGTTSPDQKLHISGTIHQTDGTADTYFGLGSDNDNYISTNGGFTRFRNGGTTQLNIASNGLATFTPSGEFAALFENTNTAGGQHCYVDIKSNGGSNGLAILRFITDVAESGGTSAIYGSQDDLLFLTGTGAAYSTRLTIESGGNMTLASGLSLYTQGTGRLYTHNLTLREQDNTAKFQIYSSGGGCVFYNNESNGAYYFYTNGAERMSIDASGQIGIGTSTVTGVKLYVNASEHALVAKSGSTGYAAIIADNGGSSGTRYFMSFRISNTEVGKITSTGSATVYATSSDYRLKENLEYTWDATTRLKKLKPVRFNFIADETDTLVDGFLAHEVQDVVPEAISGEKDAVDSKGNPEHQGIDQSKLVPLLTKALQEQQAQIELLKQEVESLKQ